MITMTSSASFGRRETSNPFFYCQIREVGQESIRDRTVSKPCHRAPLVEFGSLAKTKLHARLLRMPIFPTQRRTIDVPSMIRCSDWRKIKALQCSQTDSTHIRWIQPSHLASVTGVMTTRKKPDTHQGSYALAISVWGPVCTMESILEEWTTLRSPDALGAIFVMPSTWFEILVKDASPSRSLLWFLCSVVRDVCLILCP